MCRSSCSLRKISSPPLYIGTLYTRNIPNATLVILLCTQTRRGTRRRYSRPYVSLVLEISSLIYTYACIYTREKDCALENICICTCIIHYTQRRRTTTKKIFPHTIRVCVFLCIRDYYVAKYIYVSDVYIVCLMLANSRKWVMPSYTCVYI